MLECETHYTNSESLLLFHALLASRIIFIQARPPWA